MAPPPAFSVACRGIEVHIFEAINAGLVTDLSVVPDSPRMSFPTTGPWPLVTSTCSTSSSPFKSTSSISGAKWRQIPGRRHFGGNASTAVRFVIELAFRECWVGSDGSRRKQQLPGQREPSTFRCVDRSSCIASAACTASERPPRAWIRNLPDRVDHIVLAFDGVQRLDELRERCF
jgi:hypothetical protein